MFPKYYNHSDQQEFELVDKFLSTNSKIINVINGIPRFVENNNYASAFGEQWKKYRLTQLDSFTKVAISRDRLKRCFGEHFDNLEDKLVLEAGCGAGRFTEILLQKKSKLVSFDLSDAVDANALNFPLNDRLLFQGDIYDIPFKIEQFDIVACLGVVQHTPNTEKTIKALYDQVKPGGWLIFDHYTFRLSHFTKLTEFYRFFIKRMPPLKGLKVTDTLTNIFFPLHKAVRKVYPLQVILSRISPVHSYYFAYPELNHQQQYELSKLDTHDSLTDWFKHFRTKDQIKKYLQSLGAIEVYSEYSSHGVEARCKKPFN